MLPKGWTTVPMNSQPFVAEILASGHRYRIVFREKTLALLQAGQWVADTRFDFTFYDAARMQLEIDRAMLEGTS